MKSRHAPTSASLFFGGAVAAIALMAKGRDTLEALHAELVAFEDELERAEAVQ